MSAYLLNLLIAIDQLINALIGGFPDETLSSCAWRMEQKGQRYWGWTRRAIDMLFFWQDGHCRLSYEAELSREQLPSELRSTHG